MHIFHVACDQEKPIFSLTQSAVLLTVLDNKNRPAGPVSLVTPQLPYLALN